MSEINLDTVTKEMNDAQGYIAGLFAVWNHKPKT